METNEQMQSVLRKTLEDELERFLAHVNELAEGELERLEEQAVKTSQAMGRNLLEGVLNSRLHEQRPAARREGSCGHVQRLVGERPKELITLVGKVTVVRAYYQCLPGGKVEEERGCTHGEAPADVLWGVRWIWNLVAEHFPQAVQIVDLSHAKEHVWEVAHAVFGQGTAAAAWATPACSLLEQGQIARLVSAIQALPPNPAGTRASAQ